MSFDSVGLPLAVKFGLGAFCGLANTGGFVDLLAEHARLLREQLRAEHARAAEVRRREVARLYWSGPDKIAREVLRQFGLTAEQLGLVPRSVFSSEYRRRQRARVKRRRR